MGSQDRSCQTTHRRRWRWNRNPRRDSAWHPPRWLPSWPLRAHAHRHPAAGVLERATAQARAGDPAGSAGSSAAPRAGGAGRGARAGCLSTAPRCPAPPPRAATAPHPSPPTARGPTPTHRAGPGAATWTPARLPPASAGVSAPDRAGLRRCAAGGLPLQSPLSELITEPAPAPALGKRGEGKAGGRERRGRGRGTQRRGARDRHLQLPGSVPGAMATTVSSPAGLPAAPTPGFSPPRGPESPPPPPSSWRRVRNPTGTWTPVPSGRNTRAGGLRPANP